MKVIVLSSLLLFSNALFAADEKGSYAIWGAGTKSCFSYTKTRNGEDDSFYRNYLKGYLTAYNTQAPDTYRVSGDKDLTAVLAWFDDYCEQKPVHGFDQAVVEFIIEQHPKRHKRAQKQGRR